MGYQLDKDGFYEVDEAALCGYCDVFSPSVTEQ
jgi:hypothetical protein